MQNRGAEAVLVNVLDPNREVNPQFLDYIVVTTDGRTLSGMLAAETANSVTLKRAEAATDTVLRAEHQADAEPGRSRSCPRDWSSRSIRRAWRTSSLTS